MSRLGPYWMLRQLNAGGMTEILLVSDGGGSRFAARRLLEEYSDRRAYVRRFLNGAAVLGKLDHPNIVRLIRSGKDGKQPYELLEFVPGRNMRQLLLARDPTLQTARGDILVGLAAALEHLHERGFLHLDLKPENVMVTPEGQPKLVDFDLAAPTGPNRPRRRLAGTPTYLAPEQVQKRSVDERTDIFTFGLVAYELVAGQPPTTGDTVQEILAQRASETSPVPPQALAEHGAPPQLEQVIRTCLENDPSGRYSSMTLVRYDLQKIFS